MVRCLTLVDLGTEINPNKNWISLMQSISLYCDFEIQNFPKKIHRDLTGLDFGNVYNGFHNVWIFDFDSNQEIDIIELEKIVQHLPIISRLNETIKFDINCALIDSDYKNTHFLMI
jgi:hypothetical protein